MSKLISGKEALIALANDQEVEYFDEKLGEWVYMDMTHHFKRDFRLKPRTITINGVELAPCYAVGIDHIKNEVSIQFNNNEDAVKLNNLLLNIYGFRNA